MFENLGPKIKTIAKIWLWISIALSVIFCIFSFYYTGRTSICLLTLLVGICISIFNSVILSGFGQLVENSDAMRKQLCGASHETSGGTSKEGEWVCTCGRINPADTYQCQCGCWR